MTDMETVLMEFRGNVLESFGRAEEDIEHLVQDLFNKLKNTGERRQAKRWVLIAVEDMQNYLDEMYDNMKRLRVNKMKSLQGKGRDHETR